jgi:DNA-binding IscR family transcriptional regulator
MIDGPIASLMRRSRRAHQRCGDCADEATCRNRKVFAEVFWSYLVLIESLKLADLLDQPVAAQQVLSVASA